MEVVLQNSVILIRTDFKTMHAPWMREFLSLHAPHMLFLPKSVLVFYNEGFKAKREIFLRSLSRHYTKIHEFDETFFLRSILRCIGHSIKIELSETHRAERVTVELYAYDANRVNISLCVPNAWVLSYLHSQLELYVVDESPVSLLLDMSEMVAKARLERTLNRCHVLHYNIEYRYDHLFMQRLYADYADFSFDEERYHEQISDMIHYHTILECPVGSSQDALKKSYKKLVKVYHPDRVHCENSAVVNHYTQKFQLLQEAYTALRIVS